MIRVHRWLGENPGIDARMIMQVHDELVFEVASEACDGLLAPVTECMAGAADLQVPLVVDIGTGANWDEAH